MFLKLLLLLIMSRILTGKSIWKAKQEVDSNNKDENNAILNSWPRW